MPSVRLFLTALVCSACDVSPAPTWHVVRVEDRTLSELALVTGVSVARLQAINRLDGELVRGGTGLLVPDTERTRALPPYRPPLPAPDWKACTALEEVPVREVSSGTCVKKMCAGDACACLTSEEDPSMELTLGLASWTLQSSPILGGSVETLHHVKVDLDGDGARESVLSLREGVGNGLGIEWWRHFVLSQGRPVASFISIDTPAAFVQQPKGCAFLAVREAWRDDQLRGEGSYWVGQLHVLQGSAMRAVGPEVYRRYTYRFASQRWATLSEDTARPLPWFTDLGAFLWPEVPVKETCWSAPVVLEDDDGRFELGARGSFDRGDFEAVLDRETGAVMLEDYRPYGEARWTGRTATVCEAGERRTLSL